MALKSNRAAVGQKLREAIDTRLDKSGIVISNNAKVLCPIDTGRLRSSLTYVKEGDTVQVGTNVFYGKFVELSTRYMAAQPYLRPGLNNSIPALKSIWKAPIDE